MNVDQLIQVLKRNKSFMDCVTAWKVLPAQKGQFSDFPAEMDPRILNVLRQRGIHRLYTHQAESFAAAVDKHFKIRQS